MSRRRMLRSLGRCCLEKVDLLVVAGGVVGVPGLPQLSPATPKNPPPFIASSLLFCFHGDGGNQYSIHGCTGNLKVR